MPRRPKRGGRRPGAGRPPAPDGRGATAPVLSFRLDAITEAAVNLLVAHYQKHDGGAAEYVRTRGGAISTALVEHARMVGIELDDEYRAVRARRSGK